MQVNKKQNKTTNNAKQNATTVANMQDIINYINALAQTNNNISLQKVTGYIAVKYGNKTIMELHDKKKAVAHITLSNKNKAYKILQNANAVTRVVPDSYGWRLNTECLLKKEALAVATAVIDSLIEEYATLFNAKNNKQTKTDKQVA